MSAQKCACVRVCVGVSGHTGEDVRVLVCMRGRSESTRRSCSALGTGGDYWCVKTPDVRGNNVMIVHVQTFACVHMCGAQMCASVRGALDMESAGT